MHKSKAPLRKQAELGVCRIGETVSAFIPMSWQESHPSQALNNYGTKKELTWRNPANKTWLALLQTDKLRQRQRTAHTEIRATTKTGPFCSVPNMRI